MESIFGPETQKLMNSDNEILSKGKVYLEDKIESYKEDLQEIEWRLSLPDDYFDSENFELSDNRIRQGTKSFWEERYKKARENLDNLLEFMASSNISQIETIVAELKDIPYDNKTEDCFYSWEDVCFSMLRHPESVELDYDSCPECGEKRARILFVSPEWTWANMCGVSGEMIICPHCKKQSSFIVGVRN